MLNFAAHNRGCASYSPERDKEVEIDLDRRGTAGSCNAVRYGSSIAEFLTTSVFSLIIWQVINLLHQNRNGYGLMQVLSNGNQNLMGQP